MILKSDSTKPWPFRDNSVDAIVCDPPYGLEFMGKEWDSLGAKFRKQSENDIKRGQEENHICGRFRLTMPEKFIAGKSMQLWHTQWLAEAYRVLKPGGSMLVMGGTRTFHRLACAIEDSGFIIKDTLMWVYGSGFPKAQDLGKMIDKRNGRTVEDFKKLGNYLKQQRLEKRLNTNDIGKTFPSKTGGITGCFRNWEYGNNVPTLGQWKILKELLNLNNEFDWLIEREEAEREKIGEQYNIANKSNKNTGCYEWNTEKQKRLDKIDLTIPATDLAKHWDGFKVGGIKPAYEPIIWAVKPPEGSYVDNVLKWGVGAVNVDDCRIETDEQYSVKGGDRDYTHEGYQRPNKTMFQNKTDWELSPKGRFPANVIFSHHPECVQRGMKRVKANRWGKGDERQNKGDDTEFKFRSKLPINTKGYEGLDGYETVADWACVEGCPIRMLDEQSGDKTGAFAPVKQKNRPNLVYGEYEYFGDDGKSFRDDSGGASRFFYCAKSSRTERNAGLEGMEEKEKKTLNEYREPSKGRTAPKCGSPMKNNHPTVKPITLFEWLIRLVTREGQVVLDPFIGSGTTAIAAHNIGRKCIGIEKEGEYLQIAQKRIKHWNNKPLQMEMRI